LKTLLPELNGMNLTIILFLFFVYSIWFKYSLGRMIIFKKFLYLVICKNSLKKQSISNKNNWLKSHTTLRSWKY